MAEMMNEGKMFKNFLVEGNIGSGKSTFLTKLHNLKVPVLTIPEPVELWTNYQGHNYLQNFYDNPNKWGFAFQQIATNTAANEYAKHKDKESTKFFERSIFSPIKIFALSMYKSQILTQAEFDLHHKITYDIKNWIDYQIDGIIYVRTSPEVAQQRVQQRNRQEDSGIPLEYLNALHTLHDEWLSPTCEYPVLIYNNDSTTIIDDYGKVENDIMDWVRNPQFKVLNH